MGQGHRFDIARVALLVMLLAACGTTATPTTLTPTSAPTRIPPTTSAVASSSPTVIPRTPAPSPAAATATPAVTAVPGVAGTAAVTADRTALPDRAPDMTTGARSDGWVLNSIDASESGGRVSLTLHFEPLPGQIGGPQADAWFEASDTTYSIAVRGVRGSNLVVRPGEVTSLSVGPLRGYYALLVRDDTIFALVIAASRPPTAWTITAADAPGVLRLTTETR